jgi:phosphocarrier protein
MGVMMLAAGPGTEVAVEVEGPDEDQAFASIKALVENRFGESE